MTSQGVNDLNNLLSTMLDYEGLCRDAIAANERAVRDYLGGKEQALKALLGFVMKATRGKANSGAVELKLKELLGK